jgi:hypothetical protein
MADRKPLSEKCKYCKGTKQIVTRHVLYGDEVIPCDDCDEDGNEETHA